jgi:hypothetical protein
MKIYATINTTLEFDTSKAIVDDEFIQTAVEEYCTISYEGLAEYLKEKAKVKFIGMSINNKEVVSE